MSVPPIRAPELVRLDELRPHPRNYRTHPAEQRAEIAASVRAHGLYRNVVATEDGTILAGHGVVAAARDAGLEAIPVVRLALAPDDPRALKIVVGDNELGRLAESDERGLVALLRSIADEDPLLVATGFDESSFDDLLRLADARGGPLRPEDEWVGMPEFEQDDRNSVFRTVVHFASDEDAERFFALIGSPRRTSLWYPEPDGHVGSDVTEAWVAA